MDLDRQVESQAGANSRDRQAGDIVAGELERRFAAQARLGVAREGRKAIEFLKDGQVTVRTVEGLEAAEVLIVLIEAADDHLDGIVGGRDAVAADSIDQARPMALQEVEEGGRVRRGGHILMPESQDIAIALGGLGGGLGVEDVVDAVFELVSFRVLAGIVRAIDRLDVLLDVLQSVKDTRVVFGVRKDPADHRPVILAEVSDNHLGMIALGP